MFEKKPGEGLQLIQSSNHAAVGDLVVRLEQMIRRPTKRHGRERSRQSSRHHLHRQHAVILGLHHRQIRLIVMKLNCLKGKIV